MRGATGATKSEPRSKSAEPAGFGAARDDNRLGHPHRQCVGRVRQRARSLAISEGGALSAVGPRCRIADSGDAGANSALALTTVNGGLDLENSASLSTGDLTINGNVNAGIDIDATPGDGGSSLTVDVVR